MLFTVLISNQEMKSNNNQQDSKNNSRIHSLEVLVLIIIKEEHQVVLNHRTIQITLKQCIIQINLNLAIIYLQQAKIMYLEHKITSMLSNNSNKHHLLISKDKCSYHQSHSKNSLIRVHSLMLEVSKYLAKKAAN